MYDQINALLAIAYDRMTESRDAFVIAASRIGVAEDASEANVMQAIMPPADLLQAAYEAVTNAYIGDVNHPELYVTTAATITEAQGLQEEAARILRDAYQKIEDECLGKVREALRLIELWRSHNNAPPAP